MGKKTALDKAVANLKKLVDKGLVYGTATKGFPEIPVPKNGRVVAIMIPKMLKKMTTERTATTGGKATRKVAMTFKLTNEQAKVVREAIKEAKEIAQTKSDDIAFEYICLEWQMNHDSEFRDKILKQTHVEKESAANIKNKEHADIRQKRRLQKKAKPAKA